MNFENSQIFSFCPIPIYVGKIELDDIELNYCLSQNLRQLDGDGQGGFASVNTFLFHDFKLKNLRDEIEMHCNHFMYDKLKVNKNVSFELQNSWLVKHKHLDYVGEHFHVNSVLSGVLYLKVHDDCGDIIFQKERSYENLFPRCIGITFSEYNNFNSSRFRFVPTVGDIIMFPSHLHHFVTENLTNKERYSIAFNFFPRGRLGDAKNFSELTL